MRKAGSTELNEQLFKTIVQDGEMVLLIRKMVSTFIVRKWQNATEPNLMLGDLASPATVSFCLSFFGFDKIASHP